MRHPTWKKHRVPGVLVAYPKASKRISFEPLVPRDLRESSMNFIPAGHWSSDT